MSQPFKEPLPPDHILYAGCKIRVTAIDPTTGSTVSGVVLDDVSIFVRNVGGANDAALASGPFKLVIGPEG